MLGNLASLFGPRKFSRSPTKYVLGMLQNFRFFKEHIRVFIEVLCFAQKVHLDAKFLASARPCYNGLV